MHSNNDPQPGASGSTEVAGVGKRRRHSNVVCGDLTPLLRENNGGQFIETHKLSYAICLPYIETINRVRIHRMISLSSLTRYTGCACLLMSWTATQTSAQIISGLSETTISSSPGTVGIQFTVGSEPIQATSLGCWQPSGANLIEVGIWDGSGNLYESVSISNGSANATLQDGYLYIPLSAPINLAAGATFTVAGTGFLNGAIFPSFGTVTIDSSVVLDGARINAPPQSGLVFPETLLDSSQRYWPVNMTFVAVPELRVWGSLTGGALLLLAIGRRRW